MQNIGRQATCLLGLASLCLFVAQTGCTSSFQSASMSSLISQAPGARSAAALQLFPTVVDQVEFSIFNRFLPGGYAMAYLCLPPGTAFYEPGSDVLSPNADDHKLG